MPGQDWFYQTDNRLHGPISGAALRQLADRGVLNPETPIRRDDMSDWVQAKAVKGLFPSFPPPQLANASPVAPVTRSAEAPATPAAAKHPLDLFVRKTRATVPVKLPQQVARVAAVVGIATLYFGAVLPPIAGILLAIRTNTFAGLAFGMSAGIGIFVLQYVAQRMLDVIDTTITSNRSILSSMAIPDCVFVIILTGSIGAALALIVEAISERLITPAIGAVVLFAAGVFTSIVAVQPAGLSVVATSGCRAADDAVGVLTFLIKLTLRCTPVVFASVVIFGTYSCVESLFNILRADRATIAFVGLNSATSVGILVGGATVPIFVYLMMILYYMTLDVISAIVSMPAKLDAIALGRKTMNDDGT